MGEQSRKWTPTGPRLIAFRWESSLIDDKDHEVVRVTSRDTRESGERDCAATSALVAEALNVRDETGLTPRQLAERVVKLEGLLRLMRDDFAGLPHSLGYEFTHLPKIDAAIRPTPTQD